MLTVYEAGFFTASQELSLKDAAKFLVADRPQRLTQNIRRAEVDAEAEKLKVKLPVALFAGTFNRNPNGPARIADFKQPSGYMVLDWDHVDNPEALKAEVAKFPSSALTFISPSGTGVKCVVRVCPGLAGNRSAHAAFKVLAELYPGPLDERNKNLNRACFLGWDPDYVLNLNAVPVMVGRHAKALNSIDPDDGYDVWLDVLMALHSEDAESNRELAHAWSMRSVDYDGAELDSKWDGFRPDGGITIKRLYELAGLESEVSGVITMDEAGLAKAIDMLGWPLYFNSRTQRVTLNDNTLAFEAQDAELCKQLAERFQVQTGGDLRPARISKIGLYDMLPASIPHRDPFTEYLEALPELQPEQRGILERVLPEVLGSAGSPIEAEVFKKWMVGLVSRQYGSLAPLDFVPILIGEQDDGKTRFVKFLLPPSLSVYYVDVNLSTTSDTVRLLEKVIGCVIVEFSEMQEGAKLGIGALRSLLSATSIKARLAYRHDAVDYPVTWGIIGTANPGAGVIPEAAEGRRWYAIPVNIKSKGGSNAMHAWLDENRDTLWAEAYTLYKEGYSFQLSDEAKAGRAAINQRWEQHALRVARSFIVKGEAFDVRDLREAADYGRRMPKALSQMFYRADWFSKTARVGATTTTVYFPPGFDMTKEKEILKGLEEQRYASIGEV